MVMTYDTLVAPKGAAGSLANWVGYSAAKLDMPTIVDEMQSLLYSMLRVREMRTEWTFGFLAGQSTIALPARYLDPIGKVYDITNVTDYDQTDETNILKSRSYSQISGTLGASPFTTVNGSSQINVNILAHQFTQDSTITLDATAPNFNGINLANGTYAVVGIVDVNNITIDTVDTVATASGSDASTGVTFTGNALTEGAPTRWAVWNEQLKFDTAFYQPAAMKLLYYRQPANLASGSPQNSNFLTVRYPKLVRVACMAATADFMKDDAEYQKNLTALTALVQSTAAVDDLSRRGAVIGTDTP